MHKQKSVVFPIILIVIQICLLILFVAGGNFQSMGVPVLGGITILILGICIKKSSDGKKQTKAEETALEPPLLKQTQKSVEESMADIDLSVIGTEYRRRQREEFETYIDEMLDRCIRLIHAHIDSHTTAIFFPTCDNGYKIRRYLSKSDCVNKDAVIYPGVGVIGSFLKDGLKQLKLNDIVTDSMTLYYYSKDAGIRSLMACPIIADRVERGTIIVDST